MSRARAAATARSRRTSLVVLVVAGCLVATLLAPAPVLAHGLVGKLDLPIPKWLFAWAAAVVLIVSFVALATLWPTPRLEKPPHTRVLLRYPTWFDPICGAIGIALFVIVVYAGLAGEQFSPYDNLAPTFIYALFWVGLPVLSLPFGDIFRAFNPWRATARAIAWIATRVAGSRGLPAPMAYPRWLGRWPSVAAIAGFAWLELIYVNKDDPATLSYLAVGYAAVQLFGMSLFGIEKWTSRGDGYAVAFNLFSRLSPLRWYRDRLELRPPLVGVVALAAAPGTVALLATMIGSTSFDGFMNSAAWLSPSGVEMRLQSFFANLGFSSNVALELTGTVGLIAAILIIAGMYRLGIAGMYTIDRKIPRRQLGMLFVHSLVPIALAYVIAHYWSFLVYQSQATIYLASDPLGNGANLFGTANVQIDYKVLSANAVWYVQVAALLAGHVCGLTLAHDRALVIYKRSHDAVRSQYWMLAVMVAFTCLGLWLLSAAS